MAMAQQLSIPTRQQVYASVMTGEPISPNHHWLARILASWMVGDSVLPDYLGLSAEQFQAMCQHFFPDAFIPTHALSGVVADYNRMPEKEDLETLLRGGTETANQETEWLISILVSACLGLDHLWQDLGLWERPELTELMRHNFPALAERNNKDMKWKKFLYKQMCEAEGIYVCRAPSCEVCHDYAECFNIEKN